MYDQLLLFVTDPHSFRACQVLSNVITDADLTLDSTTGQLSLANNVSRPGAAVVTIEATDNRTTCRTIANGVVRRVEGGCPQSVNLQLVFVGFISCPDDIVYYLALDQAQAEINWQLPQVPSAAINVTVTESSAERLFAPGEYSVIPHKRIHVQTLINMWMSLGDVHH